MHTQFTIKSFDNGIYAVSCPQWSPAVNDGDPTMNCWVISGSEKILAIDSGAPAMEGFRTFLENQFNKSIMMLCSHGHFDHVGCNEQFEDIWLNEDDWPLLINDFTGNLTYKTMADIPYKLHNIKDGDLIDLGGRQLTAIQIKGHTCGSIMMYDHMTKSLFSGDSVAKRVLYGLQRWTPLSQYLNSLKSLSRFEISSVYSMHDAFALSGRQPEKIIRHIVSQLETTPIVLQLPGTDLKFLQIKCGENQADPDYFDMVLPLERRAEAIADLKATGYL